MSNPCLLVLIVIVTINKSLFVLLHIKIISNKTQDNMVLAGVEIIKLFQKEVRKSQHENKSKRSCN